MTDAPQFETREDWREARKPILALIEQRAREVLKPGDRIRASRCGGRKITVVMTGWDGHWITSAKHNDIAPSAIDRVNGQPMTFIDAADRPAFYSPPPAIEDRRARARWSPWDGVIYVTALRGHGVVCAILPEDVGPLLRSLVKAEEDAERIGLLPANAGPNDVLDDDVPF